MKFTNEAKVGIFAAIAITVFVLGYSYMQGTRLFAGTNAYYVIYEDVDGLRGSNPVMLNGFQVGRVDHIQMSGAGGELKIAVKIAVSKDVPVTRSSIARIVSSDFLGAKAIDMQIDHTGEPAEHLDTLVAEREPGLTESVNEMLVPVKVRTENLITSVDSVVSALQRIIESAEIEHMVTSVQGMLVSLERTFGRIDTIVGHESNRLDRIFANIESISANMRNNNEALTNVMNNVSGITDSIAAADVKQTIQQTHQTLAELDSILQKINRGEGTAGKLLNDDELYHRLNNVTESVDRLTNNIRESPSRYVNFSLFNFRRPPASASEEDDPQE